MSSRPYDSSGRRSTAARTQARVVDVAGTLFVDRGYAATSIADIAAEAQVSVALIYAAFRNKAGLLKRVVDAAIAGDDEPLAVGEREEALAVAAARGARERCRLTAELITRIHARTAPLAAVLQHAAGADADVSRLLADAEAGRREGLREFVAILDADGQLRDGLDTEHATDLVWVMADPLTYGKLVTVRGWPDADYARWLGEALYDGLVRARRPR